MSNSAIAFLAGLGSGYVKGKTSADQAAQQKQTRDLQNQLIQQQIDANAQTQANQAKLRAAGAPAAVDPNAATLDTGAGPVVYQMPAGVNSQGVAQSDAMQFRDLQASDPTVSKTATPVVASAPAAPAASAPSPAPMPIAASLGANIPAASNDPTVNPPALMPTPAAGAPAGTGPVTGAANAIPQPPAPVAPAPGTTAPITPVIGNTAAVNGVGYANPTDAAVAAAAYDTPQARAQRIIAADAQVNPVQSLTLQQQNAEFQQKQLATAQLMQKEGVFQALSALRQGDVQGMVNAFNSAGGAKIVGGASGVQLTQSTRTIPGLGTIPDYTATFMLKNADGSVTPRTVNAFDTSMQLLPLQTLLKQASDNVKNASDATLNTAKANYYSAEATKAGTPSAKTPDLAAWQKAAVPAPAVVNVPDPDNPGKNVSSPDLTVAYQTLFTQARTATTDPIQAAQLANAAVLKLRNAAATMLANAQAADPKTTLTLGQAIRQTIQDAAKFTAAVQQPATGTGGNGSSVAANGSPQAMRTAASGDMGPNINSINSEIAATTRDLSNPKMDAATRSALQMHLTSMQNQRARYLAGHPQAGAPAAPVAAPAPAPVLAARGIQPAPQPRGLLDVLGGAPTTNNGTSPGEMAALAEEVRNAKMGGVPLTDAQRLRAQQLGLIT